MSFLRKLKGGKTPLKPLTGSCYNCNNFYPEYEVIPDFTTLRGTKVPSMMCRNYCSVHNVSLPDTVNEQEEIVVNIANCKQWEQLEKI